jgi:hypothetical protein
MSFSVPDFAMGQGRSYKTSASAVAGRDSRFGCPIGLALNSRWRAGSLNPNDQARWRRGWDDAGGLHFALRDCYRSVVNGTSIEDALDAEQKLTHAQRRFLAHALELLKDLIPDAGDAAGVTYELDFDVSATTHSDGMDGEVTVFARHLRTADGAVHELVRNRLKKLRPLTDADHDWTATAAVTLAYAAGVPPYAKLRISEFSLEDGELRTVFDGNRQDALVLYQQRGNPVRASLAGGPFNPGSGCADCAFLNVCPAVTSVRGVVGIPGRAVATRALTSAHLAAYDRCPTAFQAQRRDRLPNGFADGADQDSGAIARDRGLAVHRWLQWAHSRTPARGCTPADLPDPQNLEAGSGLADSGLTRDDYNLAHPYLVHHVDSCPLHHEGLTDWIPERRAVMFDPDADIVVVSTPDLICRVEEGGPPLWRETKTAGITPSDVIEAMQRYPAFALNIAMLAAQVQARSFESAYIELEVLTPQSGRTFNVSTSEGQIVAEAQKLVADIANRYVRDLTFAPKPSGLCATCSAHRWCNPPTDMRQLVTAQVDDSEFADFADPF